MDELVEQQDLGQEIIDAISKPQPGFGADVDDEELERELEAMTQEDLDKSLLAIQETRDIDASGSDTSEDEGKAARPGSSNSAGSKPNAKTGSASKFLICISTALIFVGPLTMKSFNFENRTWIDSTRGRGSQGT